MKLKKRSVDINYAERDKDVLRYIKAFSRSHYRIPTASEIRDANKLPSTDTALYILKKLCKEKKLKHIRRGVYEVVKP